MTFNERIGTLRVLISLDSIQVEITYLMRKRDFEIKKAPKSSEEEMGAARIVNFSTFSTNGARLLIYSLIKTLRPCKGRIVLRSLDV